MYKIGVTGGIGSGKSTVCQLLKQWGAAVYDSDHRAKELMLSDSDLRTSIIEAFGAESYSEEGLNRPYLAKQVFGDEAKLQLLNSIVHPVVKADFHRWAELQRAPYVIFESAILLSARA